MASMIALVGITISILIVGGVGVWFGFQNFVTNREVQADSEIASVEVVPEIETIQLEEVKNVTSVNPENVTETEPETEPEPETGTIKRIRIGGPGPP